MSDTEIQKIEKEIQEKIQRLETLRKNTPPKEVKNYQLRDLHGEVALADLFAGKEKLIAIHNMGQGCRYCTLWADGLNGFLPHLEDRFSVVLFSKDSPEAQRRFADARGWRFRMVSHGGGDYIKEQTVGPSESNMPGIVGYEKLGSKILRRNSSVFGPGDLFCSIWHVLSIAGVGVDDWTPQYSYWKRPEKMDDGGQNLN